MFDNDFAEEVAWDETFAARYRIQHPLGAIKHTRWAAGYLPNLEAPHPFSDAILLFCDAAPSLTGIIQGPRWIDLWAAIDVTIGRAGGSQLWRIRGFEPGCMRRSVLARLDQLSSSPSVISAAETTKQPTPARMALQSGSRRASVG